MMKQIGSERNPLLLGWFLFRINKFDEAKRHIELILKQLPWNDKGKENAYDLLESDETFFVKISLSEGEDARAKLGPQTIALVTSINDDESGLIQFENAIHLCKRSVGKAKIKVVRVNGADGRISVNCRTKDIDARATRDYEPIDSELLFEHCEISKVIAIPIMNNPEHKKDVSFEVELYNPTGSIQIRKQNKTIVTIMNDHDHTIMANRMTLLVEPNIDKLRVTKTTWRQQFTDAMNANGGDLETTTFAHYIGDFLSFLWKFLFAFVPPTSIASGWLTFFISFVFIAILTTIVHDVAAVFNCLVGLEDSITAILFIAPGISLPNTFATMITAKHSKTADDTIGSIIGSNSVNVYVGLGLPWLVAAIYWKLKVGKCKDLIAGKRNE
ncbi:unnamed protein product [Rotaria sp. Silwood2]|nr:unnamed protein product [Rotaria sp. Silwood2]